MIQRSVDPDGMEAAASADAERLATTPALPWRTSAFAT